ncbi:MAG TPA: cell division protein SepF [Gaiellales bacterium]|nr:cell division protein SepF [Gaiellales bacterium]
MSVKDFWHRTQVYFGIREEDWDDEYFDDDGSAAHEDLERSYSERPNVRRLNPRRRGEEADDIFSEEPPSRVVSARGRSRRSSAVAGNGHPEVPRAAPQVGLVVPRSFNDAQKVADSLKSEVPVIVNLQTAESDLAKRLIDFSSGLTYALDGSMQRVADRVFLLTPASVTVTAEDKAMLMERGFFNQS